MKKVFVTGATGFVGNYVVEELLKRSHEVIASSASPEKAEAAAWFEKVSFIPFDFKQFDARINYYEFFQRPDLMIHLAWEGLPNYKSSFHVEENLPRHIAVLDNLIGNGLQDLTVTGTCLEYGKQEGCLREDMVALPSTPYAIAKNELRKSLEAVMNHYPLSLKWVRLFYMFGKGQNPNSLLSQLDKALHDNETVFNMSGGEQVRDYLPVQKVGEYITNIALQQKIGGIINCCSGQPISIREFVKDYLIKNKKSITLNFGHYPYTDYEPMHFWGDNSKLKMILNNE
jgi:nucleoside-diphosphate-sugar epimerase